MIDLEALTRNFVGRAIDVTKWNMDTGLDESVIAAVRRKDEIGREEVLRKWLEAYAVLMGFPRNARIEIVKQILAFADTRESHKQCTPEAGLLDNFINLYQKCNRVVLHTMSGKPRNLTSLTSKALWCCYPNDVPIYDRLAQNVLWVIAKIAKIGGSSNIADDAKSSTYRDFVGVWFYMYKKVESIICEEADKIDYPYKVRVFDRMLWVIGQKNYTGEFSLPAIKPCN